jgi:hypothetical protein
MYIEIIPNYILNIDQFFQTKQSNYVVTNKSKKKSTPRSENDNVTIVTAALAEIKKYKYST